MREPIKKAPIVLIDIEMESATVTAKNILINDVFIPPARASSSSMQRLSNFLWYFIKKTPQNNAPKMIKNVSSFVTVERLPNRILIIEPVLPENVIKSTESATPA